MVSCWFYAYKSEGKDEYWRERKFEVIGDMQSPGKRCDEEEQAKERACGHHHLQVQPRKRDWLLKKWENRPQWIARWPAN